MTKKSRPFQPFKPVEAFFDSQAETTVAKNALLSISTKLEDVRLRLQRAENLFDRVVVNPTPSWKGKEEPPDKDTIDAMDDKAFAALRTAVAKETDAMARLCGQASLAKTIHGGMTEKAQRIAKLDERIKSGSCGSPEEVAVAKKRREFIVAQLQVWNDRFSAVVGDFAQTRRKVLAKIVNLTTTFDDMFKRGSDTYAVRFGCSENDISHTLDILAEMNERMKTPPKSTKMPTMAFGGRNK